MSAATSPLPTPRAAVRRELARALLDGALLAPRVVHYAVRHARLRRELIEDLARPALVADAPSFSASRTRPLSLFVASAEVSGEVHAIHTLRAVRRALAAQGAPAPIVFGLGGAALEREGVTLIARPVERAHMGFQGLSKVLPYYLELLRASAAHVRDVPTDAFLAVDSPALFVPLARIVRRMRVPTLHFVAPQYWAWAPWRVRAYRSAFDRSLSILPFEPAWFARARLPVVHAGHPLLDALPPREDVHDTSRTLTHGDALVLLPGSRERVIEHNLPWMLRAAARVRALVTAQGAPPPRVVLVHERAELASLFDRHVAAAGAAEWVDLAFGNLHRELSRARSALSVSGTVLIDLLHQRIPAVVVYRLGRRRDVWLKDRLLTPPWFSAVNLLAASEIYPEFCFAGDGPLEEVAQAVTRAHLDQGERARQTKGLDLAAERLGPAGACERAAAHLLELATRHAR